jgi:hypothetical protein
MCLGAGLVLLRLLRVVLEPKEQVLFAFLGGAAVVSTVVFFLCVLHVAWPAVFLALGVVAVAAGSRYFPRISIDKSPYLALLGCIFLLYFFIALAPEVSPDGSGYHLGNVRRILEHHGFPWDQHSIYTAFPQGVEMLFLVAYSIGGGPAAAMVHLAFLVVLARLIVCSARRWGHPRAGWFAAVLVFASPVVGLVGASAYNDIALATCIYAVFYLAEVQLSLPKSNLLILIGLLAGWCFSIKYTGWIAIPFVAVTLRRIPVGSLIAAPWLVRNWIWLGNPFAPFLNRWFPNLLYTADLERSYLSDLRHVEGLHHWWEAPLDLTIYGAKMPGFLGPVFLLAPLSLLALRYPIGRKLLLACVIFSAPVALNPAARFLIPGLPFLALAMGIAMETSPAVLPAVATFHTIFALPPVMPLYCADWAWRIREMPVRVALGRAPEEPYTRRYVPDYPLKELLESNTAKQQKTFSFETLPTAYVDRTIVVGYESAEGDRVRSGGKPAVDFVLLRDGEHLNYDRLTPIGQRNGATLYRVD